MAIIISAFKNGHKRLDPIRSVFSCSFRFKYFFTSIHTFTFTRVNEIIYKLKKAIRMFCFEAELFTPKIS